MQTITLEDIRKANGSDDARRALCARAARALAEQNAGHQFGFDEAGVYLLRPVETVLLFSWTIMGSFVACAPQLNVTAYVKRETLTLAETGAEELSAQTVETAATA